MAVKMRLWRTAGKAELRDGGIWPTVDVTAQGATDAGTRHGPADRLFRHGDANPAQTVHHGGHWDGLTPLVRAPATQFITKAVTVETNELIVCAALTEAKTKALADALQKTHALGRKVLQFEEKDDIWKGKLTVYYLPETKAFKNFIRSVAQARPDESYFFALRADAPYIVESADAGDKATEADQFGEAGAHVATALLVNKGGTGTMFPKWVRGGLGRAISLRAEGTNTKRYGTYKATARKIVLGGGKPAPISEVWEGRGKDSEVLATSLMDYIAFGPGQA